MSTPQPMTEAEGMRRIVARVYDEMVNGRKLDLLPQFFTEHFTWHLGARDLTGIDQVRELMVGYLTAFPDLHFTVEQQVAEGNLICTRWTPFSKENRCPPSGANSNVTSSALRVARLTSSRTPCTKP